MIRTIFPGVCLSIIRSKVEKEKLSIRTVILMAMAGLSLILVWSATALFAYFLFCILLIVFEMWKKPEWFTAKLCYIIAIVVFVFVVILGMQSAFSIVIEGILQKDITFTGRTILWASAVSYIIKSPLVGYGLEQAAVTGAKLYRFTVYDSCHNFILDLLYQNGIIGFFLILVLFISTAKKVDNHISYKYNVLFTMCIFAYAVMINFEPFINGDMRLFVCMFIYMNYFNESLLEQKKQKKKKKRILKRSIVHRV